MAQLFTPRQMLALGVFVKHTRHGIVELQKLYPDQPEVAEADRRIPCTVTFGRLSQLHEHANACGRQQRMK